MESFPPPSEKVSPGLKDSYDHQPRAGNKADVWKHFILLSVVDFLASQEGLCESPFRYLETHCGKGLYLLDETGGWKEGIGRLAALPASLTSHPYFRIVGLPKGSGGVYPGSWLLVGLHLQSLGMEFRMSLYDVSREVKRNMACLGVLGVRRGPVRFTLKDGFKAFGSEESWDLALADPPFSPDPEKDRRECSRLPGVMRQRCKAFLIWYPLFSEQDPGLQPKEAQEALEITWGETNKDSSMVGCGMLLGGMLGSIGRDFFSDLQLLAQRLGGKFRQRKG